MRDWLSSNPFIAAVVGVLAGASLVAVRFLLEPAKLKHLPLLWRPSGTRASFAARAALGLGLVGGVVGFIYDIQAVPPRWASPLLWTGFGIAMAAALAVGLTARDEDSLADDHEPPGHHDRVT